MSTLTCMAYLLTMGAGHLTCQTFVKHQKQCNLWPGLLKMHPFLVIFSVCPACFIYLSHALWSMQTGYDLWHSATCVPYFLCERNKWQAWRLKTGLPFSFCLPVFGSFFFPTSFFFLVQVFCQMTCKNYLCFKL